MKHLRHLNLNSNQLNHNRSISPLEKIIEQIQHSNTPNKKFLEFVERDKEYQKATDKDRWKIILIIFTKIQ